MEQQIVELQREYDESKEECLGHQKVIQELKGSLEQVTANLEKNWLSNMFNKIYRDFVGKFGF